MRYLTKTSNGFYKIRIRIPYNLQPYFRRIEINKSLNTKTYKVAKVKAKNLISSFENILLTYELNKHDGKLMESKVNHFVKNLLQQAHTKKIDLTYITYKEAMKNFNIYYQNLDIGETKKQANLNFLNDIFLNLINKNELLYNTTFKDISRIKDLLQKLPKRNIQKYRDKSVRHLLKMKIPLEERIIVSTLKNYLKVMTRFYNFCIAQQYITVNPCHYVKIKTEISEMDEREPFTKVEIKSLKQIFPSYDVYKQIIYLTLIYTGMRISELPKAEIKVTNEGLYYFDLTNPKIKLKTKNSHRIIPFHEELIRLKAYNLLPIALNKATLNWVRRVFNEKIKVKITTSSKKVLYSLRHTVATELKYKNIDSLIISELLGHAHDGMTMGRYASRYPLEVLKEAIDKLDFS